MATKKKLLEAAAGSAGGAALNVEDVFSTYLYTGTGSAQTITNGIDLSGEGGLVWLKNRDTVSNHSWHDTERTASYQLVSNSTAAEDTLYGDLTSFNSDGFSLGTGGGGNNIANTRSIASWTFRKAPKFFDVVTYTGNGVAGRTVSHNLGTTVGALIIKRTDTTGEWIVYHKDISSINNVLFLNSTSGEFAYSSFNSTAPTSTEFTLGTRADVNASGGTYVAYLFAHNDGDGDFGSTADQDIIKCGSYTGTGANGNFVDLGFEPQFVLIKGASIGTNWLLFDNMRGVATGGQDYYLVPNTSNAEPSPFTNGIDFNSTGMTINNGGVVINSSGSNYIYIAIRRGPMAVPESATDVFAVDTRGGTSPTPPAFYLGAPVDLQVSRSDITSSNNWEARDRLRGLYGRLKLNLTDAEDSNGGNEFSFDQMLGQGSATGTNTNRYSWMWKRAPSFMDVVAYKGNLSDTDREHNLGVVPEMIIIKNRTSAQSWAVYHSGVGVNGYLLLTSAGAYSGGSLWNNTAPTDTTFSIASVAINAVNNNTDNYIAYLFASLDGVSKVGSYTGNGSSNGDSQNIDCGFSSGARFVLIKRTDNTGNWLLFDTKRGIISGNDPALRVNSTGSNFNGYDFLEPNSNGFNVLYQDVSSSYNPNISGASYIFYAIA